MGDTPRLSYLLAGLQPPEAAPARPPPPMWGGAKFVADTLGAPVDLAAALLRKSGIPATYPYGGSQSLRDGMNYLRGGQ